MPSDPEMVGLQSFGDMDQVKGNIHKPYPWNEMPSPAPVLLTFGSLNIVYQRCIMFTQPFWKTIFRLPKPPSHQIRPASRQIIPIPLHQNALKETYSLLWNVSLFFLLSAVFPSKLGKNCSNMEISLQAVCLPDTPFSLNCVSG